jgi:hypothetical protein
MIDGGCALGRDFALGDTRPCLRPDRCPFARGGAVLLGCPELWSRALTALLPGDPDLALQIVGDVVDQLSDA